MKLPRLIQDYIEWIRDPSDRVDAFYGVFSLIVPFCFLFFVIMLSLPSITKTVNWTKNKMSPNAVYLEKTGLGINDNVTIKWTCGFSHDTLLVYAKDKIVHLDFKNSGENTFLLYVNGRKIFEQTQFKPIFWKGYRYYFSIAKRNLEFYTTLTIIER